MIIRKGEHGISTQEKMRGGAGTVEKLELLPESGLNGRGRLFNIIKLEQGCSIGYHPHEGETETFYILQGTAKYNDNGDEVILNAGDTAHLENGKSHSIENCGEETLSFLALIIYAD